MAHRESACGVKMSGSVWTMGALRARRTAVDVRVTMSLMMLLTSLSFWPSRVSTHDVDTCNCNTRDRSDGTNDR